MDRTVPARERRAEDALLARRGAAGDAEAFRALVLRYQEPLLAVLRDLMPRRADREDVAQDAFVAAWVHLAAFDPERGAFFTWLVRIARNRALNVRARAAPEFVAQVPDREDPARAEDPVSREEARRRLDAELARLPDEQRAAFVLLEVHGLALAEVASIEGVPRGTVKSRASRARARLRAALTREEVVP